jgi:lipoprotein-anchoring transpeptidase ErfK/SrfK
MPAGRGRRYQLPRSPKGSRPGIQGRLWAGLVLLILLLGLGGALFWGWNQFFSPPPQPLPVANPPPPPPPPVPFVSSPSAPPRPVVQVTTNLRRWETPPPSLGPGPDRSRISTQLVASIRPSRPDPNPEPSPSGWRSRGVSNLLEAQIALASHGISTGPIDGVGGAQSAAALRAFQQLNGLEPTGALDRDTLQELRLPQPPLTAVTVNATHLAGLTRVPATWTAKAAQTQLGYESLLERVAEEAHAHPNLIRRLNPAVNWNAVAVGQSLVVPAAAYPPARRAARMRVSLAGRYLRAFDERGTLLAHFPCSIGRIAAKRPVGGLRVVVTVKDPNYTFDPAVFPESAEARAIGHKLVIPPGPNNPVGVAWIGLNRPGYGIHGTPVPEQVGRTESHGCFRLANWNAEYLRQLAWVGMPVSVEP